MLPSVWPWLLTNHAKLTKNKVFNQNFLSKKLFGVEKDNVANCPKRVFNICQSFAPIRAMFKELSKMFAYHLATVIFFHNVTSCNVLRLKFKPKFVHSLYGDYNKGAWNDLFCVLLNQCQRLCALELEGFILSVHGMSTQLLPICPYFVGRHSETLYASEWKLLRNDSETLSKRFWNVSDCYRMFPGEVTTIHRW